MSDEFAWISRYAAQPPDAESRDRIRRDLRIPAEAVVISPISDGVTPPDARRIAYYAGVIDFLKQPCHVVMPTQATRQAEAAAFVAATGTNVSLVYAAPPIVRLWPGFDVVFEADHALRRHDGTPSMAALHDWARACRVVLRLCKPRKPTGTAVPALADTLWWAGDLPASIAEA